MRELAIGTEDGFYEIHPQGGAPITVYCDLTLGADYYMCDECNQFSRYRPTDWTSIAFSYSFDWHPGVGECDGGTTLEKDAPSLEECWEQCTNDGAFTSKCVNWNDASASLGGGCHCIGERNYDFHNCTCAESYTGYGYTWSGCVPWRDHGWCGTSDCGICDGATSTGCWDFCIPTEEEIGCAFEIVMQGTLAIHDTVSGDTSGSCNRAGGYSNDHFFLISLEEDTCNSNSIMLSTCGSAFDTVRAFDLTRDGIRLTASDCMSRAWQWIHIYTESWEEIYSCDDCGHSFCGGERFRTVARVNLEAGNYWVVIEGHGESSGQYMLTYDCLMNDYDDRGDTAAYLEVCVQSGDSDWGVAVPRGAPFPGDCEAADYEHECPTGTQPIIPRTREHWVR